MATKAITACQQGAILILRGEERYQRYHVRVEGGNTMEQFQNVLIETLILATTLGIPLVILFLTGYMMRMRELGRDSDQCEGGA